VVVLFVLRFLVIVPPSYVELLSLWIVMRKKPDSCSIANPCDSSLGCTYKTKNCSAVAPPDACSIMVADPTDPNCCVAKTIICDQGDPCKTYICDITKGCQEQYKCTQGTDKCIIASCGPTGCVSTTTSCSPLNKCYTSSCDSITGKCVETAISCDDGDDCTVDSCDITTGNCKHTPMSCTPDMCSTSTCSAGKCVSTPILCNDNVDCTTDSCDITSGCKNIPDNSYCASPDPCVKSTCDAKNGCKTTAVSCPATGLRCSQATCVSYEGCANISVTCNKTSTDACAYVACKEDKSLAKPCVEETLVCGVPIDDTTTIVAAAVGATSAAVIAGIIAAVVVATGVAGGAAVAVYRSTDGDAAPTIANNPLFVASGNSQTNPLATYV